MKRARLSECQAMVMSILWDEPDIGFQEICEKVNQRFKKQRAPQTISTYLGRLEQKDYLDRQKEGKYYKYYSLVSQEEYLADELTVLQDLGFSKEMLLKAIEEIY